MKTTKHTAPATVTIEQENILQGNSEVEISEGLSKALALKTFFKETFFVLIGTEVRAFEGTHGDATHLWGDYLIGLKPNEERLSFYEWVCENLVEVEPYNEDLDNNYLVLTDEEADEQAANYIKDSLWAFNADFIIQHSKLPYEAKDMIQNYQEEKCESANDTIEALIVDIDDFIKDAISADGRGLFMSSYDGKQNEQTLYLYGKNDNANPTYFIYRIN